MADSLPIPARSGVAREPLDPTDVVLGPQPIDVSGRDGHHVIVGEVLKPGRHRAPRARRRIAVSGAVLSAAGAFVTLALMMSHHTTSASASAPASPSTPVPDLPDESAASQTPAHPAETAPAPAAPAARPVTRHTAASVPHSAADRVSRQVTSAAQQMRDEVAGGAPAWASAMRQAEARSGGPGQAQPASESSESGRTAQGHRRDSWQRPAHEAGHGGGHSGHGGHR